MEEAHHFLSALINEVGSYLHKLPGSAIFIRYVRSSYQNDPVRSAVELFLFLFFVRYLLAPSYSTQKKGMVKLTEEVRTLYSFHSLGRGLCFRFGFPMSLRWLFAFVLGMKRAAAEQVRVNCLRC